MTDRIVNTRYGDITVTNPEDSTTVTVFIDAAEASLGIDLTPKKVSELIGALQEVLAPILMRGGQSQLIDKLRDTEV